MIWSRQQEEALAACAAWLRDPHAPQVFYLAGYAGTGKTTLAKYFVENAGKWLFAAYTGKASHVLRQKGCGDASTIHSLIYTPIGETKREEFKKVKRQITELERMPSPNQNELRRLNRFYEWLLDTNQPTFGLRFDSPLAKADVDGIVIDEVSMVDKEVGQDLESFDKPILVLGDPAQLPPVGTAGYFTKRDPDMMLTDVHRQARESGILRLATDIRNGNGWRHGVYDDVAIVSDVDTLDEVDQVLVGTNKVRRQLNAQMRAVRGFKEDGPERDDRLVCLRNNHPAGLYNGSQWRVTFANNRYKHVSVDLALRSEDDDRSLTSVAWLDHFFGSDRRLQEMDWKVRRSRDEFDFSYALTVHKAQGSQWDSVLLFDQSRVFRGDAKRWLYTGVTRAARELVVVRQ